MFFWYNILGKKCFINVIVIVFSSYVCISSPCLPVRVSLDDRFISFTWVTVVSYGVISGGSGSAELLHRKLSLIRKFHVFCSFDELAQGTRFELQVLFNRVVIEVKDQDVLLELAFIWCWDDYYDKEAEVASKHILFACSAELFCSEMLQKCVYLCCCYGDAHVSTLKFITFIITAEDALEAEGQVNKILHQGCSPWWRKKTPLAFLPLENENFKRQTLISSTEFVSHFLEDIRNIKNTLPRGMKYLWQRRKTNVFSHNSGILLLVFIQQQTLLDEEHLLWN